MKKQLNESVEINLTDKEILAWVESNKKFKKFLDKTNKRIAKRKKNR